METQYVIGLDLGGTKILAGLLDNNNSIINRVKKKSGSQFGPDEVVKRIISAIRELLDLEQVQPQEITCMGISIPGVFDAETKTVLHTPNLGMEQFPLGAILKKEFPFPVYLENDVNAGIFGEFKAGAGQGYRNILGVYPGTGIGGGLILNGQLYRGSKGLAGEFGHMIIQAGNSLCGCGQYGCIEALASRTAMAKDAVAAVAAGRIDPPLSEVGTDLKNYKSRFFKDGVENDNQIIKGIIEKASENLGIGIASAVNLLNPEVVIIGGGLIEKLGKYYLKKIRQSTCKHALGALVEDLEFKAATLGDDSVLYGAAMIAKEEEDRKNG